MKIHTHNFLSCRLIVFRIFSKPRAPRLGTLARAESLGDGPTLEACNTDPRVMEAWESRLRWEAELHAFETIVLLTFKDAVDKLSVAAFLPGRWRDQAEEMNTDSIWRRKTWNMDIGAIWEHFFKELCLECFWVIWASGTNLAYFFKQVGFFRILGCSR